MEEEEKKKKKSAAGCVLAAQRFERPPESWGRDALVAGFE
jgi:hypothetical protein